MTDDDSNNYFDVLIIGAGISGISTAYHLQTECPTNKTFAILEGRPNLGGTWDLFQYPGIRSDSDMHTLGFEFKPWIHEKAIADGPSILAYLEETVDEFGIRPNIRFEHFVTKCEWNSATNTWTLTVETQGSVKKFQCNFLCACAGYYSYTDPYQADFKGQADFQGTVVHPQFWPSDLDYNNKRVIVIGSGATAMTLVPAMAPTVKHLTMVQRSPTYVTSWPDTDAVNNVLRKIMPESWAYSLTRMKNIHRQQMIYQQCRTHPEQVKAVLMQQVKAALKDTDIDVDKHFTPTYNPWDQRFCLVPNNDLFLALKSGKASIVTDTIDTWTSHGIRLSSGHEIEADIIVTATGLRLSLMGDIPFFVNGQRVDFSRAFTYKGMAFSGVPNLVHTFGYINASWTLKADLVAHYVCRLLNHMDATQTRRCTPTLTTTTCDTVVAQDNHQKEEEEKKQDDGTTGTMDDAADKNKTTSVPTVEASPFIQNFSSGYMQRDMHRWPQTLQHPWINAQNYAHDKQLFRKDPVDDGVMIFTS